MSSDAFETGAGSPKAGVAKRRQASGVPALGLTDVAGSLDALSLEQALKDVDIANARVVDLTQRLVSAHQQIVDTQVAMAQLEAKMAEQRARYQRVLSSRAYRIANRYWRILGALRGME
jgi:hypothetical protein